MKMSDNRLDKKVGQETVDDIMKYLIRLTKSEGPVSNCMKHLHISKKVRTQLLIQYYNQN